MVFEKDTDLGWTRFRNYLLELAWLEAQMLREKSTFGYLWESISTEIASGFKTRPYFLDTLQHMVYIAMGARPGFCCISQSESAAPTKIIEEVYEKVYDLESYAPLLMGVERFQTSACHDPIYYSFNYPTVLNSAIDVDKPHRTINSIREIKRLTDLMRRKIQADATSITSVLKNIDYVFFHDEEDIYKEITLSKYIPQDDHRIYNAMAHYREKSIPSAARFFRVVYEFHTLKANLN